MNPDTPTMVLAISTIILVGVTGFYAYQTKKTVLVLEKTAKVSVMPHLRAIIHPIGLVDISFMIKNVGIGVANNVEFYFLINKNHETRTKIKKHLIMPQDSDKFFIPIDRIKLKQVWTIKKIKVQY